MLMKSDHISGTSDFKIMLISYRIVCIQRSSNDFDNPVSVYGYLRTKGLIPDTIPEAQEV